MLSSTKTDNSSQRELPFPKLMILKHDFNSNQYIILALKKHGSNLDGIVVFTLNSFIKLGSHLTGFDSRVFEDYHGSVTLTQE